MSLRTINRILLLLFILAIGNIIAVKFLGFILIGVSESFEDLIYSLSLPYLAGCFVYFFTNLYPKKRMDKKRIRLVRDEVNYKLNQIDKRLEWLNVKDIDDKEKFKQILERIAYDDVVSMRRSITAYECLNQIKGYVEELREYGMPFLLATERPDLVEIFKKATLRPNFMNPEMQYINKSLDELKSKKLDVGMYLYGLIYSLKKLMSELK